MEIDNHILSLSMEFERQNIIINEYETNKAKFAHDRAYKRRNRTAKRISEPENNGAKGDEEAYEGNMCIMFYITQGPRWWGARGAVAPQHFGR